MTGITLEREMKPAMWRGLRCRCPNCGEGQMFQSYLKTVEHCDVCQQDLSVHRADDGPAYLTILIVGHILGFVMHFMWTAFRPDPLFMAIVLTVACVSLSLFLLPRLKGMIIAIQWSKRMHGFSKDAS